MKKRYGEFSSITSSKRKKRLVAEDEAAFEDSTQAIMEVPRELVPPGPGTDRKAQTVAVGPN